MTGSGIAKKKRYESLIGDRWIRGLLCGKFQQKEARVVFRLSASLVGFFLPQFELPEVVLAC